MATTIGSILPVGTIIHSMLTTAQFATQYGTNWVLADGRSVTGTLYASVTGSSTIPDMRGAFLRAKDHGLGRNPDGDTALGTYQASETLQHTHNSTYSIQGRELGATPGLTVPTDYIGLSYDLALGGAITVISENGTYPNSAGAGVSNASTTIISTAIGGNETRSKNVTVNVFIRIN